MDVVAVRLDTSLPVEKVYTLLRFVDQNKHARIKSFIHKEDKDRCLIGDILVRYMIGAALRISPCEVKFTHNEYGKPFIEGSPVYFNLSHSGSWVVAAVDDNENGVDVQEIGECNLEIAQQFYRKSEYMKILDVNEQHRADLFYEYWTLKECYIKTAGKGLSMALNSFVLQKLEKDIYKSYLEDKEIYLKLYPLDSSYKMAVSSLSCRFSNLRILTPQELYTLFITSLNTHSSHVFNIRSKNNINWKDGQELWKK
ncbi:4'-phosphopantetheinyl transferase family protein [Bacillus infantis]|uniref:4'-phosphopantetheinyl transferase superfamily protein n=1 Tax=Bacillus infantis TaxID=324767 RepID=A0A5D4RMS0_9BACI|nr:4'-phosphopantetheinyl transferase superfamily protein [Bacillus infantis]TYS51124.1 4'-phosphopantetheinyl transferase superfamily protein [Bacillus infantis]